MQSSVRERLPVALAACAAAVVLKGELFFISAFVLYAAGMVFYNGRSSSLAALAALAGLSVLSRSSAAQYAFLLAGSLLAAVSCESRIRCMLFIASSIAAALSGSLQGIAVYVAASVILLVIGSTRYRRYAMIASFTLAAFVFGLPGPVSPGQLTAGEKAEDETVVWLSPLELDLASPSVRLEARDRSPELMTLEISAGGVRDTLPVGTVVSGRDSFPVPPGNTILNLRYPVLPVEVTITRERKPFTHPVIHLISAGARNE